MFVILGMGAEWIETCFRDCLKDPDFDLRNAALPNAHMRGPGKLLCRLHYSGKINRYIRLPRKQMWYKKLSDIPKLKDPNEEIYFLIHPGSKMAFDKGFLDYMRKRYSHLHLISWLTAPIQNYWAENAEDSVAFLKATYDLVITYNKADAEQYALQWVEGRIYCPVHIQNTDLPKSDVFFLGSAKLGMSHDRFNLILSCYEHLKAAGLKLDFHITDVPEEFQKYPDEIEYNRPMRYEKNVEHLLASKCILEVGATANASATMRFVEAIVYRRFLLSNLESCRSEELFDENSMQIFHTAEDIDVDFIKKEIPIRNIGADRFSPRHYLETVRSLCNKAEAPHHET